MVESQDDAMSDAQVRSHLARPYPIRTSVCRKIEGLAHKVSTGFPTTIPLYGLLKSTRGHDKETGRSGFSQASVSYTAK